MANESVRRSTRCLPGREPANVELLVNGRHAVAIVVNESMDGIAVQLRDASQFAVGQQLEVIRHDTAVPALVRNIASQGIFHRVGLEWISTADECVQPHP